MIAHLDKLWSEAVKVRARHRSELSGKTERLHSHHILHKPTFRLRWELDNGVCITAGEHKFIAHGTRLRSRTFEEWALSRLDKATVDKLMIMERTTGSVDMKAVEIYLKQKLEDYRKWEKEGTPLSQILYEDDAKLSLLDIL